MSSFLNLFLKHTCILMLLIFHRRLVCFISAGKFIPMIIWLENVFGLLFYHCLNIALWFGLVRPNLGLPLSALPLFFLSSKLHPFFACDQTTSELLSTTHSIFILTPVLRNITPFLILYLLVTFAILFKHFLSNPFTFYLSLIFVLYSALHSQYGFKRRCRSKYRFIQHPLNLHSTPLFFVAPCILNPSFT